MNAITKLPSTAPKFDAATTEKIRERVAAWAEENWRNASPSHFNAFVAGYRAALEDSKHG